jgi:mannose-6-phosphate isomerase-like protein (cupin superfamily)
MAFFIDERLAPSTDLRGGRGSSFRLINETTGSQLVDFHVNILKPNSGPGPYHYHSNAENIYYVIEGRAKVTIEGTETFAGPGEAVFIPAGERHDVENVGDGDLKVIEVKAPWDSDFITVPAPAPPAA